MQICKVYVNIHILFQSRYISFSKVTNQSFNLETLALKVDGNLTTIISRFLNGMGLGFVLAVTSVYIVEIATTGTMH